MRVCRTDSEQHSEGERRLGAIGYRELSGWDLGGMNSIRRKSKISIMERSCRRASSKELAKTCFKASLGFFIKTNYPSVLSGKGVR